MLTPKLCPYCGEIPIYHNYGDSPDSGVGPGFRFLHAVKCPKCGMQGPVINECNLRNDQGSLGVATREARRIAIAIWNRTALTPYTLDNEGDDND